jgi:hypothetical protein
MRHFKIKRMEPGQALALVLPIYSPKKYKNGMLKEFCSINKMSFQKVLRAKRCRGTNVEWRNNFAQVYLSIFGDSLGNPKVDILKRDILKLFQTDFKNVKNIKFPRMCGNVWHEIKSYIMFARSTSSCQASITFLE